MSGYRHGAIMSELEKEFSYTNQNGDSGASLVLPMECAVPNQIVFPANFTTASAMAFTNPDGSVQLVSSNLALPVAGPLTDAELRAAPIAVTISGAGGGSGGAGLTDTELRAGPVQVSGPLTDAQLRAAAIPTGAADGAVVALGAVADAAAGADTGNFSLIALTKRLLGKFAVGQKPMAQSLAVTLASDQSNLEPGGTAITGTAMPAGGAGLTGWLSAIYKSCAAPTPTGTNHIGGVAVDDVADALVTAGSVTAAGAVVAVPTTGFAGGSFQVTSAGTTCTITYEQSNDNVTWAALPVISLAVATAVPVLTSNAAGIYGFVSSAAYVRARVSTYTSGTVAVSLAQKRVAQHVSGTSLAGGAASIGSVSVSGTINTSTGYTDSSTALAAGATFTGTGRGSAGLVQYAYFGASVYADQAGTLYLEQSLDTGATYFPVASMAVAANVGGQLVARMTGAFTAATQYRVRYVNGAAAQATFRLSSSCVDS